MKEISAVDLALVPIGGWGPTLGADEHLDPDRAAEAVRKVGASWTLPVHYGTYWPMGMRRLRPANHRRLFEEPPERFRQTVLERRVPTVVLTPPFGVRQLLDPGAGPR